MGQLTPCSDEDSVLAEFSKSNVASVYESEQRIASIDDDDEGAPDQNGLGNSPGHDADVSWIHWDRHDTPDHNAPRNSLDPDAEMSLSPWPPGSPSPGSPSNPWSGASSQRGSLDGMWEYDAEVQRVTAAAAET